MGERPLVKTTRRRVADPVLRWRAFGHNQQYRVFIRNEDTGEVRIIYEGFRQDCRLPADFRLTSDQLSMRLYSRPADDPHATYTRRQDATPLMRLGDDLETPAPDLLVSREVVGATAYRLLIRDLLSHDILVDMISDRPRFLLPAGQMRERATEWLIRARVSGAWRGNKWVEVTPEMRQAAFDRAARVVVMKEKKGRAAEATGSQRPATHLVLSPDVPPVTTGCALVVPVTAQPALASEPAGRSVLAVQWGEGRGDGAVERVAAMLEARGLNGWFFLDVELANGLNAKAVAPLARRLAQNGHRIGVMVGRGDLAPDGADLAMRFAGMIAALEGVIDPASAGVLLTEGPDREAWLDALAAAGREGVIASRGALTGMSEWMRWRMAPFAGADRLIVFPTTTFLSTPAHRRDRVVRHGLGNRDALAAGSACETLAALSTFERPWPILIEIDPLRLLDRRPSRDRAEADLWNNTLRQALPAWLKAGWRRSAKGFEVARGFSEIQQELLAGLLDGIAQSRPATLDWDSLFGVGRSSAWLGEATSVEPVIEQRRGARRFRMSAVRRYDVAYRAALGGRP